jgi:hypothetical protein
MQDKKDFNSTNGSKGKTQELIQKKSQRGHGCLCCVCCKDGSMERKSDMKDEKNLNSTKMDQRGKPPDRQKKIPPGAWMSVRCECCVLSGRGLCDELVPRPEKSYRMWRV